LYVGGAAESIPKESARIFYETAVSPSSLCEPVRALLGARQLSINASTKFDESWNRWPKSPFWQSFICGPEAKGQNSLSDFL
jgi:hypothetical protein